MSIYDKPVDTLLFADIDLLLSEQAVENLRLEFKVQAPGKDESLKKLSSFANTYGGYLVVGVEAESSSGRAKAIPGVEAIPGYKQRIVEWCFAGVSPPIQPFISDPIQTGDPSKVCYVIYIPESDEAPHFVNNRKGAYVRTDEFSGRFEAQLATYEEIQHLSNRRAAARNRRDLLFARAEQRFSTFISQEYAGRDDTVGELGATLSLAICPRFPATPLVQHKRLLEVVENTRVPWRQFGFPGQHTSISQHESILIPDPGGGFSLFEASVWGQMYYACEIERVERERKGIHLPFLLGHLLVYLEHARAIYTELGFQGTLDARLRLTRVRENPFLYSSQGFLEVGPASKFDDEVEFTFELTTDALTQQDDIAGEILRTIFFSLNWARVGSDNESIQQFVRQGRRYNMWER